MELGKLFFFVHHRPFPPVIMIAWKSISTIYNARAKCGQTTPTSWTSSSWRHRIYDTHSHCPKNTHTHILISKQDSNNRSNQCLLKKKWSSYQRPCNLLMTKGVSLPREITKHCSQILWANCFQTLGDIRRRSHSSLAPLQQSIRARSVAQGDPVTSAPFRILPFKLHVSVKWWKWGFDRTFKAIRKHRKQLFNSACGAIQYKRLILLKMITFTNWYANTHTQR